MSMFGEIFAGMGMAGPGMFMGEMDEDDMDDFFMSMGGGGSGMPGMGMGGMGMPMMFMPGGLDGDELGSEEEEEILEEFMMSHCEQIGKKKWRCEIDGKEFSVSLDVSRSLSGKSLGFRLIVARAY